MANAVLIILSLTIPHTTAMEQATAANPIRKVVTMLQNVQKSVTAEGEKEELQRNHGTFVSNYKRQFIPCFFTVDTIFETTSLNVVAMLFAADQENENMTWRRRQFDAMVFQCWDLDGGQNNVGTLCNSKAFFFRKFFLIIVNSCIQRNVSQGSFSNFIFWPISMIS